MTNISTIIFSFNNEKIIEKCIESVKLIGGDIILIDQQSRDKTAALAKKKSIQTIEFPHSNYVEPARGFGIDQAKSDWVFILDADEQITPDLAEEIKKAIRSSEFTHFRIPRKNIFIDRWLKYGGWWPDRQIRLINRKYFKTWPKTIHSTPVIAGKEGVLTTPLLHFFHGDLKTMVNKTLVFEDIEAGMLFAADKPVKTATFFRKFFGELWRRLFAKLGFLDGSVGIIESIYQAFSKTITYLLLYEKKIKSRSL